MEDFNLILNYRTFCLLELGIEMNISKHNQTMHPRLITLKENNTSVIIQNTEEAHPSFNNGNIKPLCLIVCYIYLLSFFLF